MKRTVKAPAQVPPMKQPRRKAPRFDLIPTTALRRIAARFGLGDKKFGAWSWLGMPADEATDMDLLNHAIDHLLAYRDRLVAARRLGPAFEDDDLAGAAWGCMILMERESGASLEEMAKSTTDHGDL